MKKPTVDDIKKRHKAYETHYSQLHSDQEDMDDFYELVFDAGVPTQYATRMPSTARDWIDVGVRHFTLDNPKAKVRVRSDNDTAREQAEKLEMAYNYWLWIAVQKIKEAAKKLLLRGEVFLEIGMDDKFLGQEGEERLFHWPLTLDVPDPINVFASPAHRGMVPADVIKSFYITVAEAEEMCNRNGWEWTTTKQPHKSVKWLSYISDEWRCFMIDGEPILKGEVQPNILGFCPYVHIGSGAGQSSYEGKPEYMYRSLIWGKRDMLRLEVRLLSAIDAINARYAFPRYKAKIQNIDDELVKKLYPYGIPTDPNQWLYEIPERFEIDILQGEQPPAGLFQEYSFLQAQSQPPEVLAGLRPQGVYSGQHQETLLATAKPIYKDAFKNLEDGLAVAMGMGAKIIEQVYNYPVQIKNFASEESTGYRKINPSDIKGYYDCEVQLLAEPPEATDIRKALGKGLRQGGSISHMTELMQYHDMSRKEAEDELARKIAEDLMAQPIMTEVAAKNAMTRLGMDRELEEVNRAQQEQNQRLVKGNPPIQAGEGVNMDLVRQRGRVGVGMETVPGGQEQLTSARLGL